jgi:imidazolonepropionase-like amidohydrolase
VIKPGAHPDLILLDGDPTRDIRLLMDAESTIDLIVKDGKIDKNIVSSPRHRIRSIR